MLINIPNYKGSIDMSPKLARSYSKFIKFMEALNTKELPDSFVIIYNEQIQQINIEEKNEKIILKEIKRTHNFILAHIMKEGHMYPKNYFLTLGLSFGLAFGTSGGIVLQSILHTPYSLGVGMPFGMLIGILFGYMIDKKKEKEGKQFDYE